jgi:hypothetical protein
MEQREVLNEMRQTLAAIDRSRHGRGAVGVR